MEITKSTLSQRRSIGVSGASGTGKVISVNYLIECLSTAGADLHVSTLKSDELSKLAKSKGLKCFKVGINSNDFRMWSMICLRNIDLIHKLKELFRKRQETSTLLHCYRRIDRVDCFCK